MTAAPPPDDPALTVRVDIGRCASSGTCAAAYPDLFLLEDDGTLVVLAPVPRTALEDVRDAAEMCPMAAIEFDA
jgi:ferredoxin